MVKAIFFDFDGVLAVETHGTVAICRALSKKYGIAYGSLEPVIDGWAKGISLSQKHFGSIIDGINRDLETHITVTDLEEATMTAEPNTEMLALAEQLRARGFKTGIITDNIVDRMQLLRDRFRLGDFSPVVVSANVGADKKQGAKIFEVALHDAKVKPEESLFIDNTPGNLKFADELGMHTYWHDRPRITSQATGGEDGR